MIELFEVINLEEALCSFKNSNLRSACSTFLQALGYTYTRDCDFDDRSVEKFIYFSAPKRVYFSNQERLYLSQISELHYIGETTQKDLLGTGYSHRKLVLISADMTCGESSRSETSYCITKILRKLFDEYILVIFRHQYKVEFCTCSDKGFVYMSEWFNAMEPKLSELFTILQLAPSCVLGTKNMEEYYEEISFALSREYIKRPESYEYVVYERCPKIIDDISETSLSKSTINELATESRNYYPELYGNDYVFMDETIVEIDDNDENWTLFELQNFISPNDEDKLYNEYFDDELIDDKINLIDCLEISEKILSDPVELLKYLESLDKKV